MTSVPLHPAIVHLPLALAFVMPALAIGIAWALWTGRARPRAWLALIALQTVLLGAGLLAMNTGEREEDRVESVVPSSALAQHEEYAESFVWATAGTLLIAVLVVPFRRSPVARTLATLTVIGTFLVTAAAIRVGHAGGTLVYVHNAGAAYSASTSAAASSVTDGAERTRQHDDDDR